MSRDISGPAGNLDYRVAHGNKESRGPGPTFICVRNAGTGDCDGVYKTADRRWLDHDVYKNRYGDCIISRESFTSAKTGETKYGFVLGKDGRPLYGSKTERLVVPTKGWKVFQGHEPVPEILTFKTWADACQHAAWYFSQEAESAAKGGHWKVVLMMADRAFDLHTNARPKGRGDLRNGGSEWSSELCSLLGTRAEALLHMGEYKRALVDACAAVHFVAAYEWSKARTRGITACLNLGVAEEQGKLLMEEMSKRGDREFPGVKALEPMIDVFLDRARGGQLKKIELKDDTPDDGRIYFRVVDPENCSMYSRPDRSAKVLGTCEFNDIVRGEQLLKKDTWLELHVSEEWDDSNGHRRAYVPLFSEEEDEDDEREEILERLQPREYPRKPRWEEMEFELRPVGLKPAGEKNIAVEYGRWQDTEPPAQGKEWPYIYKHGLAIATMLCGANEHVVDSFVRYHWVTGWNHIFLFFDDPEDPAIAHARKLEDSTTKKEVEGVGLSVILMDGEWWANARQTSRFFLRREKNQMYEAVCKGVDKRHDVDSKKMIVADLAIVEAHKMGIDWFAHIDIDECVYTPKNLDCSTRRFLGSKERAIESVRLWNHEAVPEIMEVTDWFREATLFQVNKHLCHGFKPPREYDEIWRMREGREFEPPKRDKDTKWWDDLMGKIYLRRQTAARRLKLELPPPVHDITPRECSHPAGEKLLETFYGFNTYECGKCIVRLDKHFNPPIPWGAHGFLADNGDLLKECYQACKSDDAVILHYPNANFSYWKRKYERLGELPDVRGGPVANERARRAHLAASQVVLQKGRIDQELFYKTFIMQNEYNEMPYLAEHSTVVRVEGVAQILMYYDQPHENEVLPGQMMWYDSQTGMKLGGGKITA